MFEHIIGNEKVKGYLTQMVAKGMIGNSLLFAGPKGVGKSLFAKAFAKLLICQNDPSGLHQKKLETGNHPDLTEYYPEGKIGMHSIATIRSFNEEVYKSPFEADFKVFIIHDADRMLTYSANALLKVFEEPLKTSVIILLSSAPSSLLPTVLSRCRTIRFSPLSHTETLDQNPLRMPILKLLSVGKLTTYKQLKNFIETIMEYIETAKKRVEEETRAALMQNSQETLNAVQKQSIEKEIEGAVTMLVSQEAKRLMAIILGWYRDLELLRLKGDVNLLIHPDLKESAIKRIESTDFIPLDLVQKHINETLGALERSTTLEIALENLFLKLNIL